MNPYNDPIELRKVRDFSQILNDSFTFIKLHFKPLFKSLIYICGFFFVATIAAQVLQQLKTVKLIGFAKASQGGGFAPGSIYDYTFGPEYFLLILFTILSVSAVYLVTYCYIKLYKDQHNTAPSFEEVWTLFKQYIIRFFVASILLSIFMCIGFVFCLIPGFYLFPIVSLALPIMVMEDKGVTDAFSRSSSLLKDHWWKIFGVIILSTFIAYFSMGILSLPSGLLSIGSVFIENSPKLLLAGTIFGSILTGFSQIFYALPAITSALCYFSLSEEKDGSSLFERMGTFGTNHNRNDDWPQEEY